MSNSCKGCLHTKMCFLTQKSDSSGRCEFLDEARYNEIMQAEREGRLVILPVAVKQDVYVLSKHTKCICMGQIVGIKLNGFTTPQEWIEYKYEHPVFGETASYERIDVALGRKVFLTLAEAEKALEEAK